MHRSYRGKNARRGFTLVEIVAVVVVIGLLATILIPSVARHMNKAKYMATKGMITRIRGAVEEFNMDNNRYPGSLNELVTKSGDIKRWPEGGYLDGRMTVPNDPYGNPYFYRTPGPGGREYVIGSLAKDGKEGGEGWDEDIDCWKIMEEGSP